MIATPQPTSTSGGPRSLADPRPNHPATSVNTRATPLLVAIEGTCFAGKTTLAARLAGVLDALVVPEYSDLAPLPPFPPRTHADVCAGLSALLDLETRRSAQALARPVSPVVFDRSPLSCVAFQYGVRCLGVPCDHRLTVDLFADAAHRAQITLPHLYIYLHIDRDEALARQRVRGPVAPHLMEPHVIDRMQDAYQHFLDRLPDDRRLILDATMPTASLTWHAADFIAAARHGCEVPLAAFSHLKELT